MNTKQSALHFIFWWDTVVINLSQSIMNTFLDDRRDKQECDQFVKAIFYLIMG